MRTFPEELTHYNNWVAWRIEQREGKETKVPYSLLSGMKADPTDCSDWTSFEEAKRSLTNRRYSGIGFVFSSNDSFAGIDIDDAFDENKNLKPEAQAIVDLLSSYTEFSPSGNGVHIIVKGVTPGIATKRSYNGLKSVELYSHDRYFTVTGNHVPCTPHTVKERSNEYEKLRTLLSPDKAPVTPEWIGRANDPLDDSTLLNNARTAKNGDKFRKLYDQGDCTEYDDDESAANLALCILLAFWAGEDGYAQVDRLFRQSKLMRPKWNSPRGDSTWGKNTIQTAYVFQTDYYKLKSPLTFTPEDDDPFAERRLRSASELSPTIVEKPLYPGLYRGKVTFLVGETGAGKSSLLHNLAVYATTNTNLWGIKFGIEQPLRILYVDPENGGNLTCTKLDRIGLGRPANLVFSDGAGVDLNNPKHIQSLQRRVTEGLFDIVILDPIANLFNTQDENNNAEAARQMKTLTELSRKTNACIVAVHHTGKNSSGDYGRGASARLAAADVGIMFRYIGQGEDDNDTYSSSIIRQRFDLCRYQIVKNRLEGKGSIYLQMAGEDKFNLSSHVDWKSRNLAKITIINKAKLAEEEIATHLADANWYMKADIYEKVGHKLNGEGFGETAINKALKTMLEDGRLEEKTGAKNAKSYRLRQENDQTSAA